MRKALVFIALVIGGAAAAALPCTPENAGAVRYVPTDGGFLEWCDGTDYRRIGGAAVDAGSKPTAQQISECQRQCERTAYGCQGDVTGRPACQPPIFLGEAACKSRCRF